MSEWERSLQGFTAGSLRIQPPRSRRAQPKQERPQPQRLPSSAERFAATLATPEGQEDFLRACVKAVVEMSEQARGWAFRQGLGPRDQDTLVSVGYALVFQGEVDLIEVYDKLSIPYVVETTATGKPYPLRIEEPVAPEPPPMPDAADGI